jgi:hypothetical protein
MISATASDLSALRAAALAGDRVAMLMLADLAEAGMDDARADAWRWLADPPERGRERRVRDLCRGDATTPHGQVFASSVLLFFGPGNAGWSWSWDSRHGWRSGDDGQLSQAPGGVPPPGVREAVLSACRLALAG